MLFSHFGSYTVKPGDTLVQIALDRGLCSKSSNWPGACLAVADQIKALNPSLISNVNMIQPGWNLTLPGESSAPAAAAAAPQNALLALLKQYWWLGLGVLGLGVAIVAGDSKK